MPASRSGSKLRPRTKACLSLFAVSTQPRGHNTATRSSTLSVRLESWNGRMRKEEIACPNAKVPKSQQNAEKRKEEKGTMRRIWLCVGGLIPCYPHPCCRPATLYPRYCVAHSVAPTQPRGGWRQMGSHTSHQSSWYQCFSPLSRASVTYMSL